MHAISNTDIKSTKVEMTTSNIKNVEIVRGVNNGERV